MLFGHTQSKSYLQNANWTHIGNNVQVINTTATYILGMQRQAKSAKSSHVRKIGQRRESFIITAHCNDESRDTHHRNEYQ